jgi:uncharacterized protein (TIGR02466 family)
MHVTAFGTTIIVRDFSDRDAELAAMLAVVRHERATHRKGIRISSVRGWHSRYGFFEQLAFAPVLRDALEAARGVEPGPLAVIQGWAAVSPRGAGNKRHRHEGLVSGVYYIQTEPGSSPLVFHAPASAQPPSQDIAVEAVTGRLVLFPAWLEHSVVANQLETDRVVLSFNLATPTPGSSMLGR